MTLCGPPDVVIAPIRDTALTLSSDFTAGRGSLGKNSLQILNSKLLFIFQMSGLSQVKDRTDNAPYHKPVRCKVVAADPVRSYGSTQGQRQSLTIAVADSEMALKVVAYAHFEKLAVNKSVFLKNIIIKSGS